MPRSFLVKKTEKVKYVSPPVESKKTFVSDDKEELDLKSESEAEVFKESREKVITEVCDRVSPLPQPPPLPPLTTTPRPDVTDDVQSNTPKTMQDFPRPWMLPYHPTMNSYAVKQSPEDLYARKLHLKDEPVVSPFLPYGPTLHPLAVRLENSYLQDLMSNARASLYSSLGHQTVTDLPVSSSPVSNDDEVYDKSSIFGLDLRTTKASSALPSPPPSDASSISPGRDSVSSRSTSSKISTFQSGVTVAYTYDAFFVTDGRSRKKNHLGLPEKTRPRYTCNECGKNYATSSNLSRHKQTHRSLDSQQAKKCPHCEKVYVSMPALSMHILTHELKHKCPICNKSFSRPWLLQGHMRSHTGEKPYGCAHCGKAFADRSNLRAHMQTHSAFKHFECQRCHKSFALKSYLNKHYESACFKDGLECKPMYCD